MLIQTLALTTAEAYLAAVLQLDAAIDAVEWRLDYCALLDLTVLRQALTSCPCPVIFTLRSREQGGDFSGSEDERVQAWRALLTLQPDYADLEVNAAESWWQQLPDLSPKTQWIASWHDFLATPSADSLDQQLALMKTRPADYYKLITTANDSLESLRLLCWLQQQADDLPLLCHAMGELGKITRILGRIYGSRANYIVATADDAVASGQLSLHEVLNLYPYHRMSAATQCYALVGDPVATSLGHLFHNEYFKQHAIDAVYVKCRLTSEELSLGLQALTELRFKGLSVTMPHKRAVASLVERREPRLLSAFNTLVWQGHWIATNTDGLGVVEALQHWLPALPTSVCIIGAGGAAEAIALALQQQGVAIVIVNRTLSTAERVAALVAGRAYALSDIEPLSTCMDVVINTLPIKAYEQAAWLSRLHHLVTDKTVAMDIVYNQGETPFQRWAQGLALDFRDGQAMFLAQAQAQQRLWLGD